MTITKDEAKAQAARRPWRYRGVGTWLLSPDFLIGVPVGILAAASTWFSPEVRDGLSGVLIGVAGVGAAVATLVLTSLAVLLGTITPAYRRMLTQVSGGVVGTARPFQWVIGLSAATTAWALVAAGVVPLVRDIGWATFAITAPAFSLLLWAVFGCFQVTGQLIKHWAAREEAEALQERREAAQKCLERQADARR